jgi:hypothetical protein
MKSSRRSSPPVPRKLVSRLERFVDAGNAAVPSLFSLASSGLVATSAGPEAFEVLAVFLRNLVELCQERAGWVKVFYWCGCGSPRSVNVRVVFLQKRPGVRRNELRELWEQFRFLQVRHGFSACLGDLVAPTMKFACSYFGEPSAPCRVVAASSTARQFLAGRMWNTCQFSGRGCPADHGF